MLRGLHAGHVPPNCAHSAQSQRVRLASHVALVVPSHMRMLPQLMLACFRLTSLCASARPDPPAQRHPLLPPQPSPPPPLPARPHGAHDPPHHLEPRSRSPSGAPPGIAMRGHNVKRQVDAAAASQEDGGADPPAALRILSSARAASTEEGGGAA